MVFSNICAGISAREILQRTREEKKESRNETFVEWDQRESGATEPIWMKVYGS